ncbi:PQQ-dependent sugar dehydrogenase [Streptosporangium lutulentum]
MTAPNTQGQLDQIGEPHGLTIAPNGKVFYIGKAACATGPIANWNDPKVGLGCGTIHQWDPRTKQVKLLTTLPVMGNRGSGDELVKNEEGLVGITLDPDFAENGWIYAYWMPHASIDRDRRIGKRTVSRFDYDSRTQTIDQSSRKDLLQWDTQIHSCCHAGGGMTFDEDGNLYIGTGDSNSSGGSGGYSGNNWTQDYKGTSFQDARRTSGNTNDLNGKILRIHPEPDGTYTIPEGNLFTGEEEGGGKTRAEIWVMGVRNIARLEWDKKNDWITASWVGPDSQRPERDVGTGEVRDRDGSHLRRQPGLAVLHGQQAALPRPQQQQRHPARRVVRLRQPEEHLAAQHRPRRHPAGPRQHDLVLAAGRWPGLPGAAGRQRSPDLQAGRGDLHHALPQGRRPGGHVGPDLPPLPDRHRQRGRVAGVLGRQVVHR